MRDPYEVLGVARNASAKEIKAAYRKLAKKHHPDQNPGDSKAKDRFAAANQAYEILGDEKQRARQESVSAAHREAAAGGCMAVWWRSARATMMTAMVLMVTSTSAMPLTPHVRSPVPSVLSRQVAK